MQRGCSRRSTASRATLRRRLPHPSPTQTPGPPKPALPSSMRFSAGPSSARRTSSPLTEPGKLPAPSKPLPTTSLACPAARISSGFRAVSPFTSASTATRPPAPRRKRRTFSEYVERAARALNNANLAIYPVDARGLIGPAAANRGFSAASRGPRRGGLPPVGTLSPSRANFDTMNILADRTGGRAFYNTNDIQGSIRRAIEDSRLTYVLGYYPSHGAWDGKFREIKVQMNRPGLHLRYRRGYFALPDVPLEFKQRELLLREAVGSPLQATGLGLKIRVQPVDVPGARTLKMDLQLDPRDIGLQPEGDRWVGAVDLLFVQIAADGRQITGEAKTFNMRLLRQTYDSILKDGLVLTRTLPLADGAAQVRVVTRDATSGALGSVTIPLDKLFSKAGS